MKEPQILEKAKEAEVEFRPKVVVVTGANSGLGYEACRLFCREGHTVVLACRQLDAADKAASDLQIENPNCRTYVLQLDLASVVSIRQFVEEFRATREPLHVLVNNAGVGINLHHPDMLISEEGYELTLATNHLGHFLLTNLLLDDLKKTAAGGDEVRVVMLSSESHEHDVFNKSGVRGPKPVTAMDLENLMMEQEGTYNTAQAYKDSKAANIMFVYEMARRLEGSGVNINALCPGFIPRTNLLRNASAPSRFYNRYILDGVMRPFRKGATRRPEEGGQFIFELATDDKYKGVTGKYFKEGVEAQSSVETRDTDLQHKLWGLTMRLLNEADGRREAIEAKRKAEAAAILDEDDDGGAAAAAEEAEEAAPTEGQREEKGEADAKEAKETKDAAEDSSKTSANGSSVTEAVGNSIE